jgi:hypothetical protein
MTGVGHRRALTACVFLTLIAAGPLSAQDAQPNADDQHGAVCAEDQPESRGGDDLQPAIPDGCITDIDEQEQKRRDAAYQRVVKQRMEEEKPPHSLFPKWLHADGLWMPTTIGVSTYGIAGAHVVVANIDRVYFFGPPGFMLVLDDTGGQRRIRPALTWGISVLLFDLPVPGARRTAQVYFNMTKCWTSGPYQDAVNLAGLSIAWKK